MWVRPKKSSMHLLKCEVNLEKEGLLFSSSVILLSPAISRLSVSPPQVAQQRLPRSTRLQGSWSSEAVHN